MSSIYQQQINQINAHTSAQVTQLEQEGQAAFNDGMAKSQQASQQAQQAQQQSDVATRDAEASSQAAQQQASVMQTTGSAGNLYQKDLTKAQSDMGYDPKNLVQSQSLSQQISGGLKNQQMEMLGAGRRGLSSLGVENVNRQIQTGANNELEKVGKHIATLQNEYTATQNVAGKESKAEFTQEQTSYNADIQAFHDYQTMAAQWSQQAQQFRKDAQSYAETATTNLNSFHQAALSVQQTAQLVTQQIRNQAEAASQQAAAAAAMARAGNNQSMTALVNQQNAYNQAIMDSRNTAQILNIASSGSGWQLYGFLKTIYTGGNTQAAEASFTSFLGGLSQNQRSSVWNKLTGFRANLFGGDMNFHPFGM